MSAKLKSPVAAAETGMGNLERSNNALTGVTSRNFLPAAPPTSHKLRSPTLHGMPGLPHAPSTGTNMARPVGVKPIRISTSSGKK